MCINLLTFRAAMFFGRVQAKDSSFGQVSFGDRVPKRKLADCGENTSSIKVVFTLIAVFLFLFGSRKTAAIRYECENIHEYLICNWAVRCSRHRISSLFIFCMIYVVCVLVFLCLDDLLNVRHNDHKTITYQHAPCHCSSLPRVSPKENVLYELLEQNIFFTGALSSGT